MGRVHLEKAWISGWKVASSGDWACFWKLLCAIPKQGKVFLVHVCSESKHTPWSPNCPDEKGLICINFCWLSYIWMVLHTPWTIRCAIWTIFFIPLKAQMASFAADIPTVSIPSYNNPYWYHPACIITICFVCLPLKSVLKLQLVHSAKLLTGTRWSMPPWFWNDLISPIQVLNYGLLKL